jgi:hypothetical protein
MISLTLDNQNERATWSLAMNARPDNDFESIDPKTSRSICDAIGERLQQSMRPESGLSERLQKLLNEFRQRDLSRS